MKLLPYLLRQTALIVLLVCFLYCAFAASQYVASRHDWFNDKLPEGRSLHAEYDMENTALVVAPGAAAALCVLLLIEPRRN